jgi:hypothetical protein
MTISLSSSGLQRTTADRYAKDFVFAVGNSQYRCPMFIAEFVSPRVSILHDADPTLSSITLESDDPNEFFASFLNLAYGWDVALDEANHGFFRAFARELRNSELISTIKSRFPERVTSETVIETLQEKSRYCESCSEELDFIARHFEELSEAVLATLDQDQLYEVFRNPNFRISNEDWLFATLSRCWEEDSKYLFLTEFVQFEHLSASRFGEFISDLIELLPWLNRRIWDRICPRLNILASSSTISFAVEVLKHNSLLFTMPFDNTVLDLKHAILRRTGIPVTSQKLKIGENQMNDNCLLSDYGIQTGSVIELVSEVSPNIRSADLAKPKADSGPPQVTVRYHTTLMRMPVGPSTTAAELKEMVAKEVGVPADTLWLICNGNMLRDESRLDQVGVHSNSKVVAGSKRRRPPDSGGPGD